MEEYLHGHPLPWLSSGFGLVFLDNYSTSAGLVEKDPVGVASSGGVFV